MQANFKEEWIVKVGKEAFSLNEKEIVILREAMRRNERWVNFKDMIISIPHIECIFLSHREISDQLPEGDKELPSLPTDRWNVFKKEIYKKIGKL